MPAGGTPPARVPDRHLTVAVERAEALEGPYPYVGVSWRDLSRYNRYEDAGSGFVLTEADRNLTQLYAAISVYSRDVLHQLTRTPRPESAAFLELVSTVSAAERRRYGAEAFPYDDPQFPHVHELRAFPRDLAATAERGSNVFTALAADQVRHEWTVKPGKKLFLAVLERGGVQLRKSVCGRGGLASKLKRAGDQFGIAKEAAGVLLVYIGGPATIWYPLVAAVAVVLVKRGLRSYCDGNRD